MATYELLATDLDGTLFGTDMVIRPRTRQALRRWVDAGRRLVIATGRMYRSARETAVALGIDSPIICYQGALVRCPLSGTDLIHRRLPVQPALVAIAQLEAAGFSVLGLRNDTIYARRINDATRLYAGLSHAVPQHLARWADMFSEGGPTKLVAVAEPEKVAAMVSELRLAHAGALHVMQSLPYFLDVVHPLANKGAALASLCEQLDVPLSATVGVGDGQNDVELVATAGLGVAMSGGHPELIARADQVTGPLEAEGLAELVEWLLSDPSPGASPPR